MVCAYPHGIGTDSESATVAVGFDESTVTVEAANVAVKPGSVTGEPGSVTVTDGEVA